MATVALIDRPGLKVEVRADLADQYMVCDACDGRGRWPRCVYYNPWAFSGGGLYALYDGAYVCSQCWGASIVKKTASLAQDERG